MANDNSYNKTYLDGDALLEADLDAGFLSVQPSISNLAYSTTGSAANEILASTGSNAVPDWITPNTFAATISATGANAILSVVSSCQASVANLIGLNMGATAANSIIGAISSCQATIANLIGLQMTATAANAIVNAVTRSVASTVTNLGIAVSTDSGAFFTSSTSYVDVTGLSVSITTNGRPVKIELIPGTIPTASPGSGASYVEVLNTTTNNAISWLHILRGTTTVAVTMLRTGFPSGTAGQLHVPPCAVGHIDTPSSGTYTYKIQGAVDATSTGLLVNNVKLVAYEL